MGSATKAAMVSGPSQDELLQVIGDARHEVGLALTFDSATVVVGVVCAQDAERCQRRIEMGQVGRQAGERARRDGHPMVGPFAGDYLVFFRVADNVGVIAQQLDVGVIGIRAGIAEEHFRVLDRHHAGQFVRQVHAGLMGLAAEHMGEGQFAQLLADAVDQFAIAIAQAGAPQPRHSLQVLLALVVVHVNAFASLDNQLLGSHQVGGGVDHC